MKKVALITGVNGQDGAYLAQFLIKKNYKVIGTAKTIAKSKIWRLKRIKIDKKIVFCKLNLNNKKNIEYIFNKYKFDEFYNLAGHSIVTTSFKNYLNIANSTAMGVIRILDAIKNCNRNSTKLPHLRFLEILAKSFKMKKQISIQKIHMLFQSCLLTLLQEILENITIFMQFQEFYLIMSRH